MLAYGCITSDRSIVFSVLYYLNIILNRIINIMLDLTLFKQVIQMAMVLYPVIILVALGGFFNLFFILKEFSLNVCCRVDCQMFVNFI